MRVTQTYHGIPPTLAVSYLEGLGGRVDGVDGTAASPEGGPIQALVGAGWQAWVETLEERRLGSISLTTIRVTISGAEEVVRPLFESFTLRMRRGGG